MTPVTDKYDAPLLLDNQSSRRFHVMAKPSGSTCDHYIYPEYRVGNIKDQTLDTQVFSRAQVKFGYVKKLVSIIPQLRLRARTGFSRANWNGSRIVRSRS